MSLVRVAFDEDAAFTVACEELLFGPHRFARGAPFPWRDLGVSPFDLFILWTALKIDVDPVGPPREVTLDGGRKVTMTPGHRVDVLTPAQNRADRRASRR
ncbi:MAG: hypothetical protein QOI20_3279 [Acidimicrobiaceae bacterium]|jgi:hypothetical protein|nr:hypothetical protein [Acidimicrobiaceae bacterium]